MLLEPFGDKLRTLRKEKGYTQNELGEKLGLSGVSIMRYEKNQREPSFETLYKIADIFGVPLKEFLGEDPTEDINTDYLDTLASELNLMMKEYNISIKDLSLKTNIKLEDLRNYVEAKEFPTYPDLKKLKKYTDIDKSIILELEQFLDNYIVIGDYVEESFLYDRIYDIYEYVYKENKYKKNNNLSHIVFFNRDRYFSESLFKNIIESIKYNIEIYQSRIRNQENTPRLTTLRVTYPFLDNSDETFNKDSENFLEKSYALGEKNDDFRYLEYEIKRLSTLLSKSLKESIDFKDYDFNFSKERYVNHYKKLLKDIENIFDKALEYKDK